MAVPRPVPSFEFASTRQRPSTRESGRHAQAPDLVARNCHPHTCRSTLIACTFMGSSMHRVTRARGPVLAWTLLPLVLVGARLLGKPSACFDIMNTTRHDLFAFDIRSMRLHAALSYAAIEFNSVPTLVLRPSSGGKGDGLLYSPSCFILGPVYLLTLLTIPLTMQALGHKNCRSKYLRCKAERNRFLETDTVYSCRPTPRR